MEPRSWLCQLRVRTSADRRNSRLVVLAAEDRRAGHDRSRAGRDCLSRRPLVLTTIDLDHWIEPALQAHFPDTPDLGKHLRQEGLPAEPGIDCHHQDDVA